MNNIFENAYFGKVYKTRGGKRVIYHGSKKHKSSDDKVWTYHYLMTEPITINLFGEDMVINHYDAYINDNGIGRFANLKYCQGSGANAEYDIVSEWQEINEEELDELAEHWCPESGSYREGDIETQRVIRNAYKAGYRKAKQE